MLNQLRLTWPKLQILKVFSSKFNRFKRFEDSQEVSFKIDLILIGCDFFKQFNPEKARESTSALLNVNGLIFFSRFRYNQTS